MTTPVLISINMITVTVEIVNNTPTQDHKASVYTKSCVYLFTAALNGLGLLSASCAMEKYTTKKK